MFVNITNGVSSCRVSKGAFDNFYKSIGYSIVDETVDVVKVDNIKDTEEVKDFEEDYDSKSEELSSNDVDEDEAFIEDIMEKPISQWSNDELKKFATIKGIDTSSAKKVSEARNIIKEFLINEEKNAINA